MEKLEKTKVSKIEIPAGRVRRGAVEENILKISWKGFSQFEESGLCLFFARRRVEALPSDGIST